MSIRFDHEIKKDEAPKGVLGGKIRDLLADHNHRRNLGIFVVQWITGVYAYYNIYFQLKYFKGDIFTNVINAGVSEMTSNVIAGLIFQRIGLRNTYLVSLTLGFICSTIFFTFGHAFESLIPFLLLGAFFGYTSVLLINWIATPHLFPVLYASSCQGFCNAIARCAAILAPQLAELDQPIPMIIVSVLTLISAALVLFLKPIQAHSTN
jgi:predicted MFS family arabinose efflux permease